MMRNRFLFWAGLVVFTALALFLTFNRHSKAGYFNYHSEIWADKAGYYVYLPAAFNYRFDPALFPDSVDENTGKGFKLDYEHHRVFTKYTCGVALLQSPFYLAANFLAERLQYARNGFSPPYHKAVSVAAVFYLVLGLVFLGRFLRYYFPAGITYAVLASVFLATNLYYYAIDETGMSHVYSFGLFCVYLYLLKKTRFLQNARLGQVLLFGLVAGFIVLIRPTSILFLSACFFLDLASGQELVARLKRVFQPVIIFPVALVILLVISPQLLYWNYLHGSTIAYSYGNEGFNWASPQLLRTWFSPNNGLFLYSPFYLVCIAGLVVMIRNKALNGMYILLLFLAVSYVFSAWWDWTFGCSFGARSFVEYLALLSLPLGYFYTKAKNAGKLQVAAVTVLVIALALFNLKMTYSFDECFYGTRGWDWPEYRKLVLTPPK